MDENHRHLAALGVSHPALETIRENLKAQYNLTTKLTGAGGGGCTVSLIPDGKNSTLFTSSLHEADAEHADFKGELGTLMMEELIRQGFEPYLTSVGGSGLGILSPYTEHRTRELHMKPIPEQLGQLTPPGTPGPRKIPSQLESLRQPFLSANVTGMTDWATNLGRWLYV
jgi:hypothetical protein